MALENASNFSPFASTQQDMTSGMYGGNLQEQQIPEETQNIQESEPQEQVSTPVQEEPVVTQQETKVVEEQPKEEEKSSIPEQLQPDPKQTAETVKPPMQTEEILHRPTPEEQEAMKKNNLSDRVICTIGNAEEYQESMETEFTQDPRDQKDKIEDPSEFLLKGGQAANYGFLTKNQILLARMIKTLQENQIKLDQAVKELRIARISPTAYLKKSENGVLDGKLAGMAVIAATQGTYRVLLYNSGFNIVLRPITIEMADEFINAVDRDFQELGRILGGFYHLPMSVFLKQKLAEFLPKLVVNSNLTNWREPGVLLNAISFQDYDTILWALGTMLFRDGVGIGILCCNKDCRNHSDSHFIDLAKACYLNLDRLKGPAVTWMMQTSVPRTAEDIETYKTQILGNIKRYTPEKSNVTYVMRDPSLNSYINHGCDIIGKLADAINDNTEPILDDDDEDTVKEKTLAIKREKERQIGIQLYRMLIPWIDHLEIKDKSSEKPIIVKGYEAIDASLESRANVNSNLYNELEDFIRNSRCSYYCTSYVQCPRCGKKLDFATNDLTPIDMEYLFFFLSCLMLEQAGLES